MAERWINSPVWVKALSLLAACGLLLAMIDYVVLQPRQRDLHEALLAQQQLRSQVAQLRHKVVGLASTTRAAAQFTAGIPPRSFSLVDLLSRSGGNLQKWLPEEKQATLEMRLAWQKLPALFVVLSGYHAVQPQAFTVEPEGERLRLTLKLDLASVP